jgi:arylsulfatase A-like enzyme
VFALAACSRAPERWNVLLITVDTLRADHLGCYGYERATSPHLDALAKESMVFTRAQTPRAKTTPAVASLLSGLYPHEHGVRDLAQPLDARVPMLQETLRAAGYRTGAIVGNWVLTDARAGLARGFDAWCESLPDAIGVPPDDVPQRSARSLTDGALVALGLEPGGAHNVEPRESFVRGDAPWFLWLHYMDPHGPYSPPREYDVFASAAPDPIAPPAERDPLHQVRIADYNVPADARLADGTIDAARVRDRYDGEIRSTDAEIGRLLERLRAAGSLERTLIVVTADHGESLGEHLYWFEHGVYAYQSTCRVPLIVRVPRGARGSRRGEVSLVDLAPTVCELVGVAPGSLAGTSRAALFERDPPAPRAVFSEKVERAELGGAVQIKAVRLGDWSLIRRFTTRPGTKELVALSEELYDLAADPLESRDLSSSPPSTAPLDDLRRDLARFTAADRDFPELAELLQHRREILERGDPEALRKLRALGY